MTTTTGTISEDAHLHYVLRGETPPIVSHAHIAFFRDDAREPGVRFDRDALATSAREYLVAVARIDARAAVRMATRLLRSTARVLVAPPPLTLPPDDGNLGAMREVALREVALRDAWLAALPWRSSGRVGMPSRFSPAIFWPLLVRRQHQSPVIEDEVATGCLVACGWERSARPYVTALHDDGTLVGLSPPTR